MQGTIKLRQATTADADLLFEWRNDPETRKASRNTAEVQPDQHVSWLSRTLRDPTRRLLIAEEAGIPVGTVRADYSGGVWELSWTVSPNARGRGVAKRMVALLASQIREPIRAEVKAENKASIKIAEIAGMVLVREETGVLHFARGALHAQPDPMTER